jgi:hypothetical protein
MNLSYCQCLTGMTGLATVLNTGVCNRLTALPSLSSAQSQVCTVQRLPRARSPTMSESLMAGSSRINDHTMWRYSRDIPVVRTLRFDAVPLAT